MTEENNSQRYFETIKCNDYEVFNINYHNKRVTKTIGLNINLQEYIYPPNEKLLKCKVVYDKDEIIDVNYLTYTQKETKTFKIVVDNQIAYKYKSTNRKELDKLYNKRENADEIIIIKDNLVTDTSIANISVYLDGVWITPKLPLLHGTTKNRLLDEGSIKEGDITLQMLQMASKIALMNAMIGFYPIEDFTLIL